ncbi:uncharacterized protein LOC103279843 isoform X2 [Anolis carolinensis]|uniref:uncharacterized protein LOC103279843 isoform X2 n=1 Tax=Anolis carolinensis TaxID=28377 RepID=UPI000462C80E
MVKKNTIPDGWRSVQPVGQPIPGTRFIAFKVPLKGAINQRLTPVQKFTPKDLIAAVKALNVELGLIIDLTYTRRYYEVKDMPKSLEYKKLFTVGLEVPDDATILQFKKWVRKFLWENAENEKLIGVHCTNGINRTGYLICRYLIDVEGWDPETAIQAFGEARGHHMDGNIYLTDLRTQPMRSNLGMNMWDADGDIVPPPNDMDGHIDKFPNEEYPRPAKRSRVYDDSHSDLPEQIRLREFDFINKGPGQRRKPYYDQQFQDDPAPQVEMRQRHFVDHHFYDEFQAEMQRNDSDFGTRGSGQRLRPCHDPQLCDDFPVSAPPEDINMGCGERQRHCPDNPPSSDILMDSQYKRSHGQRRKALYDPQTNDEYQSHMQFKNSTFHNKRPDQRMRPYHDCFPHDDIQTPVGDFEFVRRGRRQQIRPFLDHQHCNDLQREMPAEDFDDRDSESRCRPFHNSQAYDDYNEQVQFNDSLNRESEQRMRPFGDHSPHNNMPYEGYPERPDCSENYRRILSSDEIIRGGQTRFASYSSHPTHLMSSSQQEVNSAAVDCERGPQCEVTREMGQRKRLPVVTIDYNYGLPLNYTAEGEDRAHCDSHPREHYIWK